MTGLERWRGYWLLEGLIAIRVGDLPMLRLNEPTHATPTRGVFDPTVGKYDLEAGPRERDPGPRAAIVEIPSLPGYAGEAVLITPSDVRRISAHLDSAGLFDDFLAYARSDATWKIAAYWPSKRSVQWGTAAPKELRELCLLLNELEPPARTLLTDGRASKWKKSSSQTRDLDDRRRGSIN